MTTESDQSRLERRQPRSTAARHGLVTWTSQVSDDDFEGYARHHDDAFVRLLESPIHAFLQVRARSCWPGLSAADREEAVANALGALWAWWRRRPTTRPGTPAQLLAYVATTLDHAAVRTRPFPTLHPLDDPGQVPALPLHSADGMDWLCATLHAWISNPPPAASHPVRRLLRDSSLVGLVRRLGCLPRVADLIKTFALRPRAARRRHDELARLTRRAAAHFDAT
jgi:hypothetical protein